MNSAADSPRGLADWSRLKWMFSLLGPVRHLVLMAAALLCLWIGVEIFAVRQTAEAVNRVQFVRTGVPATEGLWAWLSGGSADARGLRRAVIALGFFAATMALLTYLREVTNMRLSMHMVFHLRESVYDQLQRVGLRFHDTVSTGEVINRALTDLQNVRTFINSAVLIGLEIILLVSGYIVLLMTRSPLVALLALVPLPLWIWYTLRFSRRIRPSQMAVLEAADRNVAIITENCAGVHVVKAFAAERLEIDRYNRNCDAFLAHVLARIRLYANYTPAIRGISMASHLSLFLLAAILMVRRVLQPGDILMLGSAMSAILGRLQQVAALNEQYQNAMVSAARLREVLSVAPSVPESASAIPLPEGRGAVRFEHVTFGYDPQVPVLRDVSFEVQGGQMVALVGPTGAGKSTLVQLLARFYDPQAGRIVIDGADIRDLTLDSLRSRIAIVPQETYLFSDSVEANIAYGRPQARTEEVEVVSRLAQAHEFVETLPRLYRTILGERGSTLSGGQRQRLAIARAILSRPRILILDDATASVDPETEELIYSGMRLNLRDCTVFVIAHRLNTVKRADLVVVLENGCVAQAGPHEELLRQEGHYRAIAELQLVRDGQLDADGAFLSHLARVQDPRQVTAIQASAEQPQEVSTENEP